MKKHICSTPRLTNIGNLPDKELATLSYCIQCTDKVSGNVGDFIHAGDFKAISPVFTNLAAFFTWMKTEGIESVAMGSFAIRRAPQLELKMPEGREFTSFSYVDNVGCGCTCPGCILEHGFAPCDKDMFLSEKGELIFLENLPRNAVIIDNGSQTVGGFLSRSAIAEFDGAPYLPEEASLFF